MASMHDIVLEFCNASDGADELPVSSHLLRLVSPVFEAMMATNMEEHQKTRIKVKVCQKSQFEDFYRLIQPLRPQDVRVTAATVDHVLTIADYYQVQAVKEECDRVLLQLPATVSRLVQEASC